MLINKLNLRRALLYLNLLVFSSALLAKSPAVFSGKITTTHNKGIAGVVVSDGYSTTVSDKQGRYRLQGNDSAKFVFISVPEDCVIPSKEGLPVFYKRVKGLKSSEVNFELTPKPKDSLLVLTVIADSQVQREEDVRRFQSESIPDFAALQKQYADNTAFVGLTVGDNVWDRPLLFPGYSQSFRQAGYPWFQVIGNHDHDQRIENNDYEASGLHEDFFGPTYYSFNVSDCHFVVLDNILYHGRRKNYPTLTENQLRWLAADLQHVPKDKLIVLAMHAPITRRGKNPVMTNSAAVLNLLSGYRVVVLTGHTHRMHYEQINDKVEEYTLSPIMGNSWAGDFGTDGCPNGYGVFEIVGNQLKRQYYKATGQDLSYQMRLFPVGSVEGQEESVVAHVWNYSKGWRVSVYEDNKYVGKMKRFTGYDPVAYAYFFGPDKPKRRPKLEPSRTANLFYYTLTHANAEIKVVVTDRFGHKYTEILPVKMNP